MKTNLYAILDHSTGTYNMPFPAKTEAEAKRMCLTAMASPDTVFNLYPDDFTLYYVGTFNQDTGEMQQDLFKTRIASFVELKGVSNE